APASGVTGTLALSSLPHGTAAQVLVTNSGATAPAWVSFSQDCTVSASGVVTCTGESGTGSYTFAAPTLQWLSTVSAPTLSQASTSSASGQAMHFASQASTNANGTPGGFSFDLPAPTGTGSFATLLANNPSAPGIALGENAAGQNAVWMSTSRSNVNYSLASNGTSYTALNGISVLYFQVGGFTESNWLSTGLTLFNGTTSALDGGVNVLSLADAST